LCCLRGFDLLEENSLLNVLDFNWLAFYSTKTFGENPWAIHYYAPIQGHELVTRRDLIPSEPDHPRAGAWYYALQLGSQIQYTKPVSSIHPASAAVTLPGAIP
jgi:hypothetical protein